MWLGYAAAAAAFWVTLRVMTAGAAPASASSPATVNSMPTTARDGFAPETADRALQAMIARFARSARVAQSGSEAGR
jgi:hypothetical protein